jgi:hypothetical protein
MLRTHAHWRRAVKNIESSILTPAQINNNTGDNLSALLFNSFPSPRLSPIPPHCPVSYSLSVLQLPSLTSCAPPVHVIRIAPSDPSPADPPKRSKQTWSLILIFNFHPFCSVNILAPPSSPFPITIRSLICRPRTRSSTTPLLVLANRVGVPQGKPAAYSFRDRVGEQCSLLFLLLFQPHVFQVCSSHRL